MALACTRLLSMLISCSSCACSRGLVCDSFDRSVSRAAVTSSVVTAPSALVRLAWERSEASGADTSSRRSCGSICLWSRVRRSPLLHPSHNPSAAGRRHRHVGPPRHGRDCVCSSPHANKADQSALRPSSGRDLQPRSFALPAAVAAMARPSGAASSAGAARQTTRVWDAVAQCP